MFQEFQQRQSDMQASPRERLGLGPRLRQLDLESWYSSSQAAESENYFAASERERNTSSLPSSMGTTLASRTDSVTPVAMAKRRQDEPPNKRFSMFIFGSCVTRPELQLRSSTQDDQNLKRKSRLGDFRRSIVDADLSKRFKQLVGMKRVRVVGEDEEQSAAKKRPVTIFHCHGCLCRRTEEEIQLESTSTLVQERPVPCENVEALALLESRPLVDTHPAFADDELDSDPKFEWAGNQASDFRRSVVMAEDGDWVMEN